MEMNLKSSSHENPEAEVEESMRFDNSLQELRELRSQLHHAADYCETTFLKSKEKSEITLKLHSHISTELGLEILFGLSRLHGQVHLLKFRVLENTKEYICRAVVTVVDHLGNVSANLEGLISQTNAFSEAELRIQCLKQKLLSCEQYAHKLALTKMRWSENLPRFHSRCLSSPPTLERSSSEKLRDSESKVPSKIEDKHVLKTHGNLPLSMYTHKPRPAKNLKPTTATVNGHNNLSMVVPVRDGLSVLTKVPNPTFHFQGTQKVGRHRRSLHGSDISLAMAHTTYKTNQMKNWRTNCFSC